MLSSSQVAAMMQQQTQMFTGMQQYSQVISAQMPQPMMNTIGNYGQAPPPPQYAQIPYGPRQQPGFSYGGGSFGYGLGNQMGAAGISAMAGAGQFALGGLGIAGGLGLLGKAGGMMFDPMSAGMAGFSAARGLGMGMMGGLGVGALAAGAVAAPMAIAQHALGSMVTGAQEQAGVNQALGQFNFTNPMSRTGKGFSRQDAMAIGSMTRELQAIPEMMTSMSELTRIMDKMGQSGMMQGTRDAGEFTKRFKETIHTLKDVSKMMGSTMEEAMQAFQESKQAGFYSPQAIKQNIMQRQIVGGLTGMNQQQINQMQQYGAEVSKQYGGSRAGGARSISRISGELGMAQQMGLLSNEELIEMTGSEGAEGQQKLAMSLNDVGQRMGRSSLGTAMTLALGETKDGRYTGKMDEDLVRRVRAGEISKNELLSLAHKKSAGRNAKLSFAAHRQRLTTEMVNSAGVQGISMELGEILGERGFDNPDALNLVMQRYGANEEQANQVIGLMKKMPQIQRGIQEEGTTSARRMAEQAFMKENASWEGIKGKIGKKFENTFTEPFKKLGASLSNSVGEAVDSFVDDIFGRYQTKVTEMASSTVLKASMGDKAAKALVDKARTSNRASSGAGADLRGSSLLGWATGQTTLGESQEAVLKTMGSAYYNTEIADDSPAARAAMMAQGKDILSAGGGVAGTTTSAQRAHAIRELQAKNRFEGKIRGSYGADAVGALRKELLTNEDLKEDMSDQEKMTVLQKGLNKAGVLDALRKNVKGLEGANDIDLMEAIAKEGGLGGGKMFSRAGLAKGLQGYMGSDKALADDIKDSIKKTSKKFDGQEDLARSVLTEGGDAATLVNAAFAGGPEAEELQNALGGLTAPSKKMLDRLGMTMEQFNKAKDQAGTLVSAGIKGGVSGDDLKGIAGKQLEQALRSNEKLTKSLGYSLSDRIAGADVGGLSAGGQDMLGRLSKYATSLSEGGSVDDGSLVQSLADYKGKDRGKLLGIAGGELSAGVHAIDDARSVIKRSKGDVTKLIEHFGLGGDEAKLVREMAGSDSKIDEKEQRTIEKHLGELRTKQLSAAKGGEQGTVNAAASLQKYLDEQTKAMRDVSTVLQTLVKPSGESK